MTQRRSLGQTRCSCLRWSGRQYSGSGRTDRRGRQLDVGTLSLLRESWGLPASSRARLAWVICPPLGARNVVSELADFCSAVSLRHLNLFCCLLLTSWLSHMAQNMRTQSTGPSFPMLTQAHYAKTNHACGASLTPAMIHFDFVCDRLPSSDEVRPASSKESCCAVCRSTSGCKAGVFVAN
eukprot:COSAG03_NODE_10340_length_656_cov_1.734291_1_plen_180_part_10